MTRRRGDAEMGDLGRSVYPLMEVNVGAIVSDHQIASSEVPLVRGALGPASPCYQCGVCTAACPWGVVRSEPYPVRSYVRKSQMGLEEVSPEVWLCTTCKACEALCPRGVKITGVFAGLRERAWAERRVPQGLNSLMWSLHWDGNPWRRPPSQRSAWAKGLGIKEYAPADEVLYYVGCTASYDPRIQKVAKAVVALLQASETRFGTLGDGEPCCGDAAQSLGHTQYFQDILQNSAALFQEKGVRRLITTSPHCYDIFANHLAPQIQGLEVLHYTEYLWELVQRGGLSFSTELPLRVTYHDPCYLGRGHGVYEAPRQVLSSIPGVELVEMADNREFALCCGGGGGRIWMETEAGQRFSDIRARQASETQAEVLATACPYCLSCLEDSLKGLGLQHIRVMDVAEIAYLALQREESLQSEANAMVRSGR